MSAARRPAPRGPVRWRSACLLAVLLPGCAGPAPDERATFRVPDAVSFEQANSVGDVLRARCGSLDCHGQNGRSLRIYGRFGLRLDVDAAFDVDGGTTSAEHDASYESVIGLEPEILDAVVRDHGARPERLTLIRKARGVEQHKGKTACAEGSPGDRCVASWLAGSVDLAACAASSADLVSPNHRPQ